MKTSTKHCPSPNLDDDQVLGAVCGLRPCRHGGLRLEIEKLGSQSIVHNYGHGGCGVTISFGTAEIAADLVEQVAKPNQHIAVLGAGVVGLSSARELQNRGFQVKVYADRVAHDTTSNLAGSLWLPVGIEFGSSPSEIKRKERILRRSYEIFKDIDRARYGVEALPVYEPEESNTEPGLFGHLFDYGLIEKPVQINSFPFKCDAQPGRMFTTDYIHTHEFLGALLNDVIKLGVEICERTIQCRDDLPHFSESVLVNCMALGSREVFDDHQIYPARGVLVHMKPQDLGYCVHDGYKYMFPRKNALVLGGCFQEDRWDDQPDQAMVDEILNHHRRFFGLI
jgi:D-amino-acid oxidase